MDKRRLVWISLVAILIVACLLTIVPRLASLGAGVLGSFETKRVANNAVEEMSRVADQTNSDRAEVEVQLEDGDIISGSVNFTSNEGGVVVLSGKEFNNFVAEQHRHDEAMMETGVTGVIDVASSGDDAQRDTEIAEEMSVPLSVWGLAILASAVAIIIVLLKKGVGKEGSKK